MSSATNSSCPPWEPSRWPVSSRPATATLCPLSWRCWNRRLRIAATGASTGWCRACTCGSRGSARRQTRLRPAPATAQAGQLRLPAPGRPGLLTQEPAPCLTRGATRRSEVLFTLIAERYERRSLGITSNLVFSEWERIFANPMATVSAIDRVVHHAIILEFDVPSYRTDAAQQRGQSEGVNPAKLIDGNSADLVDARHWPCTIDQSSTVSIR